MCLVFICCLYLQGRSNIRSRGGACILGQVLQMGRGDTCFKGVYGETWQTGEIQVLVEL